jgi:hypothetical protein
LFFRFLILICFCCGSVQDERLGELDTHPRYAAHRLVLTKMHREQIIRRAELEGFTAVLMPHQKAVGFTLLHRLDRRCLASPG